MVFSRVLFALGLVASTVFLSNGLFDKISDIFGNSKDSVTISTHSIDTKNAIVILVETNGQDRALSSYQNKKIGPLKTFGYALQVARTVLDKYNSKKQVVIQLGSGVFRIKTSLVFDKTLSGGASTPLIIRGADDGSTIIRGSYILRDRVSTRKLPFALGRRLSTHQHKNVIAFKIPKNYLKIPAVETHRVHYKAPGPLPFALHDQQGSLRPAQYPNLGKGWLKIQAVKKDRKTFVSGSSHLKRWSGEPDLWAGGYWKWNWAYETLPVKKINTGNRTLTLAAAPHYEMSSENRYFIFHALAELDEPGEWYLDKKRGYLIVWPREAKSVGADLGSQPTNHIELSLSNSLITVNKAKNIRFEQLVLDYSRHDAIRVTGGQNIVFNKCLIRWIGGRAAVFKNSPNSGISNSTITDIASGGIVLEGGDRPTLTPAKMFAFNNQIMRYARLGRTYKAAIRLKGVGNIASGNYIADAPHFGIYFSGNEHRIERNELTNVSNDTSDSSAIYTGRDWTARGTIIQNNYLHDIQPKEANYEIKGIYLDDMASGITVRGNVMFRVEQPVFIGGGRDNIIEQNMFIASKPGIYMDGRGLTWSKNAIINGNSEIRSHLRAVPYTSNLWKERYPHLANILKDDAASPKYNVLRHNLFVAGPRYLIEPEVNKILQTIGTDYGPNNVTVRSSYHIKDYVETAKRAEDFTPLTHKGFADNLTKPLPLDKMDRWELSGWHLNSKLVSE